MMLSQPIGRVNVPGALALSAGRGLLWGVVARVWMRLISDNPEFTWGGTIYILGAATIFGLTTGVAAISRRNEWRPAYRRIASGVAGGSVVFMGLGAGSATLPTIVLGGIALGRRDINLLARVGAFLFVVLTGVAVGSALDPVLAAVTGVGALMILTGYRPRLVLGVFAVAAAATIMGTVLTADRPDLWQRALGAALYLPLLAPLAVWFGRTVAEVPDRVAATV